MSKRRVLAFLAVLVSLVLLLVACAGVTVNSSEGQTRCPAWAGYETGTCEMKIVKLSIASSADIDMTRWDKMRLVFLGGEVLITGGTNIVVHRDTGEDVNHRTERLSPGVYIVETVDQNTSTSFGVVNFDPKVIVHLSLESVRPTK